MRRVLTMVLQLVPAVLLANATGPRETRASSSTTLAQHTVFTEDWEAGFGSWFADNGVWEVGVPTSGPGAAYQGTQCAGTVLGADYPAGANSRLISPALVLPASPLDGRLELRFWHWFRFGGGPDSGWVEVSTSGTGGPWTSISNRFIGDGGGWTHYVADLSAYAGQTVRIAFHIRDADGSDFTRGPGWFVDALSICEGTSSWLSPESFDDLIGAPPPIGGWYADRGVWQVGPPTSGPGSAYEGRFCAGTVLGSDYPAGADSRLISPRVVLPASPEDGLLWLSFRHWFSFGGGGDSGWVEVSTAGPRGPWQQLGRRFSGAGGAWTHYIADLSSYAGQGVHLAFHIRDADGSGFTRAAGWFVDNPSISEGRKILNNPEGFEHGTRGWFADRGIWQWGVPTAGPCPADSGSRCAATVLGGDYPAGADSRLVSPPLTLPSPAPPGGIELRFRHCFSFGGGGDAGWVEVSTQGPAGPWQTVSGLFTGASGGWSQYIADLTAFAGQTIHVAFHMRDGDGSGFTRGAGWFIDNVRWGGLPAGAPASPTFWFADYSVSDPPILHWINPAGPFDRISVYASRVFDFEPDIGNRIALVTGTSFADPARPGPIYLYRISAVDSDRHESVPVRPEAVTAAEPPVPVQDGMRVQAAPNPFRHATVLSFRLPHRGHVRLDVLSVSGRRVARLADEMLEPGLHTRSFDAGNLPAGIYFYRLAVPGEVRSGKLALVR